MSVAASSSSASALFIRAHVSAARCIGCAADSSVSSQGNRRGRPDGADGGGGAKRPGSCPVVADSHPLKPIVGVACNSGLHTRMHARTQTSDKAVRRGKGWMCKQYVGFLRPVDILKQGISTLLHRQHCLQAVELAVGER